MDPWDVSSQEMRDGTGGGERVTPTTGKPPAWVFRGGSPRGSGWSPLGSHPTVHSPASNGRGTGQTCCPAQPSPEQMDMAVGNSRIVLSGVLPSLVTSAPGARRVVKGM